MSDVGEKVTVYFGFKGKVKRILKEDSQGLYIDYKNKRVPVRLDPNALQTSKCYLAHPKYL